MQPFKVSELTREIRGVIALLLSLEQVGPGGIQQQLCEQVAVNPIDLQHMLGTVINLVEKPVFDHVHENRSWYDPNLIAARIVIALDELVTVTDEELASTAHRLGMEVLTLTQLSVIVEQASALIEDYRVSPWYGFA